MGTIRDVASRAGVSIGTVSNLLNGSRYVSPETEAKIRVAMRELSYRPNGLARGLRSKRSSTIGLIVPDSANPFYADLAWYVEQAGATAGFGLILCNTSSKPSQEASKIDLLLEKQVDGIIVASGSAEPLEHAILAGVPLVLLLREAPGVVADVLVVDHHRAGMQAANHLLELGHRRLGYIGHESPLSSSAYRLQGIRQALSAAGLTLPDEAVAFARSRLEDGYQATLELLGRDPEITAICTFNDMMALGAIRAAVDCGRPIPESLSLLGSDDISSAGWSVPRLTTFRRSMSEIGGWAVARIVERLADGGLSFSRYVLPMELVVRESTAPPRLSR